MPRTALTKLVDGVVLDLSGGPAMHPPFGVLIPPQASLVHFHFLPLTPSIGQPFQLLDGFTMEVSIQASRGASDFQTVLATNWTSYGSQGVIGNLPDGTQLDNPGPILNWPVPGAGYFVRGVAISNSVPAIEMTISWL